MRDKLRQLDETYLDLVIGILLCGVLSAILGMIITRGDLRYLIGAIVGTIFALVMITTEVCTDGYSSGKPEYDQECVDKICSNIGYFIRDDQT